MRTLRSHRGLLKEKDMEERVVAGCGGGVTAAAAARAGVRLS
jgi:hypothetical protein